MIVLMMSEVWVLRIWLVELGGAIRAVEGLISDVIGGATWAAGLIWERRRARLRLIKLALFSMYSLTWLAHSIETSRCRVKWNLVAIWKWPMRALWPCVDRRIVSIWARHRLRRAMSQKCWIGWDQRTWNVLLETAHGAALDRGGVQLVLRAQFVWLHSFGKLFGNKNYNIKLLSIKLAGLLKLKSRR